MTKKRNQLSFKASAYWICAAWLLTGMQSAAKVAGRYGFSIRNSLSTRYIGGLAFAAALTWFVGRSWRPYRSAKPWLQTKRSLAVAGLTFGLFSGTKLIGLGLTTALSYSWPAFSLILGWQTWLGFDEEFEFRSAVSVLITLIGVGMLVDARIGNAPASTDSKLLIVGMVTVVAAALCNGYQANIAPKIKAVDADPFTGLVWLMLIGAITTLFWNLVEWMRALPLHTSAQPRYTNISVIALIATPLCGTVAQYFYILAQAEAPAKRLTPLTSIFQLPFALFVGHFAFGEPWPAFAEAVWMIVIIAGSLLLFVPLSNKPPSAPSDAA